MCNIPIHHGEYLCHPSWHAASNVCQYKEPFIQTSSIIKPLLDRFSRKYWATIPETQDKLVFLHGEHITQDSLPVNLNVSGLVEHEAEVQSSLADILTEEVPGEG